jgi:hypothetical protein
MFDKALAVCFTVKLSESEVNQNNISNMGNVIKSRPTRCNK